MKLKKLLKGIPVKAIKGPKDIEITGVCSNSKLAAPGNLFIAKRGKTHDGSRFIAEALLAGTSAILTDIYDPFLSGVTQIIHPDPSEAEVQIAANYYQNPSQELFLVGVTGTNGKTTTSYLVKHFFDDCGIFCGLIGTVEYIVGKQHLPSNLTTPDILTNQKLLYEIVQSRYAAAVMEVSSHALDQGRVKGLEYDLGIFTNLTHEHLDYHETMDDYLLAKCKLFDGLKKGKKRYLKRALINVDDPAAKIVLTHCSCAVTTYAIDQDADLKASEVKLEKEGTSFTLHYKKQSVPFVSPLIGRFNVYNVMAAVGAALERGIELEECAEALQRFPGVPGRLDRVTNNRGLSIFVDYAHTADALKNVLLSLAELKKGRILTVFGCGGGRDTFKRPKMAEVAQEFSDFSIITSDNPRQEDPLKICQEVEKGFSQREKYAIEVDRKKAIEQIISMAKEEDIVLIAGKGHESYQMFSNITIAFDDKEVARQACVLR